MLRTSMAQKQYEVSKRNEIMYGLLSEHSDLEPSSIIKTMMKIIKTRSKNSMDSETQAQFSKIADAIVRMADEI